MRMRGIKDVGATSADRLLASGKPVLTGCRYTVRVSAKAQKANQLRALRWAQGSICAGCGKPVPSAKGLKPYYPQYPSFDHVVPQSHGGMRTLDNGILKHQRCNQNRGNSLPTGCDLVWQTVVRARLANRPKSFKPTFKGGVPNNI
ncbi:HNH endonuclease [Sphingomonas sp. 1P08PE]|uniref:HNH endonuclease n=1 Tax=Sphingomonas sp. 1P08PE TaxID=554122 RepID=UPI0039A0F96C